MAAPPPPLDDDALSADLDDDAGDDVRARIAADPESRERQAALRAAADSVAEPVTPLGDGTVDDLVQVAMAAFDAPDDHRADATEPDPTTEAGTTPVPLAPRRRRNGGGPRRWLVAAVVVVLAAIGLGLIRNGLDQSRRDDTASSSAAERATTTSPADSGADAGSATDGDQSQADRPSSTTSLPHNAVPPGEEPPTTVNRFTSIPELGSYATQADLRTALRTSLPTAERSTSDEDTLAAANRCAVTVENQMKTDPTDSAATASLEGRPVLVYELRATPPGGSDPVDLVVVVDREACTPALSFYRAG